MKTPSKSPTRTGSCSLLAILLVLTLPSLCFGLPAFPGAEGFGSTTVGGRGGTVIKVTNLNDSGAGSFRAAVTASGPRIVVFTVYGEILVESMIDITNPYLTIAGQTAPGNGVTIRNHPTSTTLQKPLKINTHDVVMRYLKIRPGAASTIPPLNASGEDPGNLDALGLGHDFGNDCYNVIIDHCSFSWATDEVLSTSANNLTLSWNIISEGLAVSTHPGTEHSKGLHLLGESNTDSDDISVHHNLLAHNLDRNPDINSSNKVDVVNNVFYNAIAWTNIKNKWDLAKVNLIKNYYKAGPNFDSWRTTNIYSGSPKPYKNSLRDWEVFFYADPDAISPTPLPKLYLLGNIGWHKTSADSGNETDIVRPGDFGTSGPILINSYRFSCPTITETSATDAYTAVLAGAGANRRLAWNAPHKLTVDTRDSVDTRIVSEVTAGTGSIKDSVPGWAAIVSGSTRPDTDDDGMADVWEALHGVSNPSADKNGDGYTNIEAYIYGIDP